MLELVLPLTFEIVSAMHRIKMQKSTGFKEKPERQREKINVGYFEETTASLF